MAKKNLASLMSGIMGEPAPISPTPVEAIEEPAPVVVETTTEFNPVAETTIEAPISPVETIEPAESVSESTEVAIGSPEQPAVEEAKPQIKRIEAKPTKTCKAKTAPPQEGRATFIVNPEHVRKIKYIALVEGNMIKDVIEEALSSYIKSWEAENERIRLPKRS